MKYEGEATSRTIVLLGKMNNCLYEREENGEKYHYFNNQNRCE